MRPKNQRLVLVILAVAAMIGAALLAMWGLSDRASFFVVPADIAARRVATGSPVRLGGMVEKGSLVRAADGVSVRFRVSDGAAAVPVTYRGILPDLFREGSGMVAEGRLAADGSFVADTILAKHDERYVPPQMRGLAEPAEAPGR